MNKRAPRIARLLAAAVALALPAFAMAQGQVHTGRSNDASNRVGSGGYNTGGIPEYNTYTKQIINTGNQIVTGNITMGREFRGNVGYSDPHAFRGNTAGSGMDNFIKNSSGVPMGNSAAPVPNTPRPFYGVGSTVQAPPGYVLNPGNANQGYQQPPTVSGARGLEDQRLGVIDLNQPLTPFPASGDLLTRGRLTQESQGGILTASPLYGIREWNPAEQGDRIFLENMLNRSNAFDRIRMDPREVQKMRDELQKATGDQPEQAKPVEGNIGPSQFDPNPYPGVGVPANPRVENKPIKDQVKGDALVAGVTTDQSYRQFVLGARKTSNQYNELAKRLEQYYGERKKTDADFAREFNDDVRAKAEAEAKAKAEASKRGTGGELNPVKPIEKPEKTDDSTKPKVKKPTPTKITTLAGGVKSETLAGVLKKAEDLMKEGKFTSALDQYDAAEAASSNNPMIWIGRANAELGAGYFMRADAHLRQAYLTDKALLLAQIDLMSLMGEERVKKIVADLKEIASKDKKPTPVFLLAYIYYNIGGEAEAQGYLQLAEQRAGAPDPVFKLIREHWDLKEKEAIPTPTHKPDGNK